MIKDVIRRSLQVSGIEVYRLEKTTMTLFKTRVKIFSILILIHQPSLIVHFLTKDDFEDRRLSFELQILEKEIMTTCARKFYEKQWEFTASKFFRDTLIRGLNDNVVLSFIKNEKIDQDGFGVVYEIKLHSDNQKLENKFRNRVHKSRSINYQLLTFHTACSKGIIGYDQS